MPHEQTHPLLLSEFRTTLQYPCEKAQGHAPDSSKIRRNDGSLLGRFNHIHHRPRHLRKNKGIHIRGNIVL